MNFLSLLDMEGYCLTGMGLISTLAGIYLITRKLDKNDPKKMLANANREAQEITIKFFMELLESDPQISLDQAIVLFEGGDYQTLELLSQARGRPIDTYRSSYEPFFKRAKMRHTHKIKA